MMMIIQYLSACAPTKCKKLPKRQRSYFKLSLHTTYSLQSNVARWVLIYIKTTSLACINWKTKKKKVIALRHIVQVSLIYIVSSPLRTKYIFMRITFYMLPYTHATSRLMHQSAAVSKQEQQKKESKTSTKHVHLNYAIKLDSSWRGVSSIKATSVSQKHHLQKFHPPALYKIPLTIYKQLSFHFLLEAVLNTQPGKCNRDRVA